MSNEYTNPGVQLDVSNTLIARHNGAELSKVSDKNESRATMRVVAPYLALNGQWAIHGLVGLYTESRIAESCCVCAS